MNGFARAYENYLEAPEFVIEFENGEAIDVEVK